MAAGVRRPAFGRHPVVANIWPVIPRHWAGNDQAGQMWPPLGGQTPKVACPPRMAAKPRVILTEYSIDPGGQLNTVRITILFHRKMCGIKPHILFRWNKISRARAVSAALMAACHRR